MATTSTSPSVFLHIPEIYIPDLSDNPVQLVGGFPILGDGAQGTVFAAKRRDKRERVAIKRFDLQRFTDTNYKQLLREWNACRTVSHPQIVDFKEAFYGGTEEQPQSFYMVFERMDYTLTRYYQMLTKKDNDAQQGAPPREHIVIALLLVQLLKALEYLNTLGIIHRDIKPGNIGIHQKGFAVKLLDFGLSRREGICGDLTKISGSALYAAPEILAATGQYNSKVDIWSVAVLVTEMLGVQITAGDVTKLPNRPSHLMLANCVLEKIIELRGMPRDKHGESFGPRFFSHDLSEGKELSEVLPLNRLGNDMNAGLNKTNYLDLLEQMLTVNPNLRPTAAQCLSHPYLASVNKRFEEKYKAESGTKNDEKEKFVADVRLLCKCVEKRS